MALHHFQCQGDTAGDDDRPAVVVAAPVGGIGAEAVRIGRCQSQRRQPEAAEDADQLAGSGEGDPFVAEPVEVAGQVEDDIDAAAGTVGGQIADFDDRLALDRLAGEAGDGGFDRLVEVGFEEQPVLASAAPAGG